MSDVLREFEIVREYNASREKVFKAWTDPELLVQWWGPEGVFTPVCEVDVRPGGAINIVMEAGESMGEYKGTQWPMRGTFEEVDEPSKLVFSAVNMQGEQDTLEHRTTVTFDEMDGKTKMTVHVVVTKLQEGMGYAVGGMQHGWNSQFDKLGKLLG
jgi:uncharacterized protein YndB with AHSA1/START domain